MSIEVKIITKDDVAIPKYETSGSAGMDLRANLTDEVLLSLINKGYRRLDDVVNPERRSFYLNPHDRVLIPTGIYLEMPKGIEAQIRPRSGNAIKRGLTVLNSPGTIDSDYRDEVGVILYNADPKNYAIIEDKERIAQMVFAKVESVILVSSLELNSTDRKGGFGHTGIK